jgi:hypothetical protein
VAYYPAKQLAMRVFESGVLPLEVGKFFADLKLTALQ